MTRIRWIVSIVSVVVIGLGVLLAVNLGNKPSTTNPTVHQPAPQFDLRAFNGQFDGTSLNLVSLSKANKVVLVNFWNEWCQPCQQETPSLVALAKAHANDPSFVMIGIVHDPNSHGAATSYATKNKMTYPLAFDPGDRTSLNYGVTGQPETFLIDKAGIVDEWVSGPIDPNAMETEIERLENT